MHEQSDELTERTVLWKCQITQIPVGDRNFTQRMAVDLPNSMEVLLHRDRHNAGLKVDLLAIVSGPASIDTICPSKQTKPSPQNGQWEAIGCSEHGPGQAGMGAGVGIGTSSWTGGGGNEWGAWMVWVDGVVDGVLDDGVEEAQKWVVRSRCDSRRGEQEVRQFGGGCRADCGQCPIIGGIGKDAVAGADDAGMGSGGGTDVLMPARLMAILHSRRNVFWNSTIPCGPDRRWGLVGRSGRANSVFPSVACSWVLLRV
jgi:hypothetical protein